MKTHYGPDLDFYNRYPVCHRDNGSGAQIPMTYDWSKVTCKYCLKEQSRHTPPTAQQLQEWQDNHKKYAAEMDRQTMNFLAFLNGN